MADHYREQILDALVTTVTGLTTTGTKVKRGRVYPLSNTDKNALSVYQGSDQRLNDDDQPWSVEDWELTLFIDIHVKNRSTQIDQQCNLIEKEIEIALKADTKLGLSFAYDLTHIQTNEPDLSGEGDKPTARVRTEWSIKYRRSSTDPSA